MDNIILIGFMGCGKTTVGQQLAKRLKYDFLDTDKQIEHINGQPVSKIFETAGEAFFRKLETETVKELIGRLHHTVVSVGGGLPVTSGNAKLLKELGTVVYLETPREVLEARLLNDTTRPLLAGKDGLKNMSLLYDKRLPFYKAAADIRLETEGKSISEVVDCLQEIANNKI